MASRAPPHSWGNLWYNHQVNYQPIIQSLFKSRIAEVVDFRCDSVEAGLVVSDVVSDRTFLCFPRRGSFFCHRKGKKEFIDPNHIAFFNASERVAISYPQSKGDDSTFLMISPEVIREIIGSFCPSAGDKENPTFPYAHVLSDPGTFLRHQLLLDSLDRSGDKDSVRVEEEVMDLTRRSLFLGSRGEAPAENDLRPSTRRAHREQVEHVKNLLAKHFHEDLLLGDLARAVASSPYHLARIFKREVGVPIHRYLNRLRLRASLHYLPDWKLGLTDLALELGYSSHSHFSDAFRREFGLSPSEMRRGVSVKRMAEIDSQSSFRTH